MHYDYESFFTNCSRCFDVIYMHVKLYSVPHKDTFFLVSYASDTFSKTARSSSN